MRSTSALTGEKGYFDTRIVFIDETGPKERRVKRLAIMDQDGANVRYLTRGEDLVLTPRFSPSTQEITYMSYGQGDPRVFLLNIETGQREIVGNFPGMTFSPRFSPDRPAGDHEPAAGTELEHLRDGPASKRTTRLTDTAAIDTAPSYAPDGARICFESDRGGRPADLRDGASGGAAQRISFGEGSYSTPVWSPRGDFIAFTKQGGGQFAIGIMKPDGSGERLLTSGYPQRGPDLRAERPRADVLPRSGRQRRAGALHGRRHRPQRAEDPDAGFASDPAWSPLLS